jgi:hypothetical protein
MSDLFITNTKEIDEIERLIDSIFTVLWTELLLNLQKWKYTNIYIYL